MQNAYLISLEEFCNKHEIEFSFVSELERSGLIEIKTIRESTFIDSDQLKELEKIIHLHYELKINIEGIESIHYLLERIKSLQNENIKLRNRLLLYEAE